MGAKTESKYQQILYRDYERTLEMFIYTNNFPELENDIQLKEFDNFVLDKNKSDKLSSEYILENQNYGSAYELDKKYKIYSKWFCKSNKYFENFKKNFEDILFPEIIFNEIYYHNEDNKICSYCGISENIIKDLIIAENIFTKSLWNRGRTMEIDRKDPTKGYTKDNIALSCYWCNNAKTDEFCGVEFENLRNGMKTIWNLRIEKYNKTSEKQIEIIK